VAGSYLLDTSIVIAALRGEPGIGERIAALPAVFLSVISLGELRFGASNSRQPEKNLARVEDFARRCALLLCDPETARRYGSLKKRQSQRGRRLPENDLWIAATADQHRLTLITRDRHFSEVEELAIAAW
jgi:tRNA(fMet)-specific endonuclease VapC